ncbi:MAG TPA: glycosyltransferase [Candidatus Methylomirabilis sp.]|nr:glycosyltransferase [Candidatus Methylomirabilis sp.]
MNYPKISLVTACYNHRQYIAETIESILSQNYPNLQYVVIDDGSTDGSWEVIQKYQDRLYHCERLEGRRDNPTTALNRGFAKTDGEIMGWLNSDDLLLPKSLFVIAEIFSQLPGVDWLTGMATTINSESKLVNSQFKPKSIYDYLSLNWKTIQQESTFWRRELWQKAGAKLNDTWAFDAELWTRFFLLAEHYNVNAPLGAFRKGKTNASLQNPTKYLTPVEESLRLMKTKAGKKLNTSAASYFLLRQIKPLLKLIPDRFFIKLPWLKKFSYQVISYSFAEQCWKIKSTNPFK